MKRLILILLVVTSIGCAGILLPQQTQAATFNPFSEACKPDNLGPGTERPAACDAPPDQDPLTGAEGDGIIIKAADLVTTVTGVAAVIVIIIAGLQYITAAGDTNKVSGAKQTIIFAVVGLIIALTAKALIAFVLGRL